MNTVSLEIILQQDIRGQLPFILDRWGRPIPCNEIEERITRLAQGIAAHEAARFTGPSVPDDELDRSILAVHDADYIAFLERTSDSLPDDETLLFDHPYLPDGIAPDTPIIAGIYHTARESARTAITAAHVAARGGLSYALCRPPGHHAGRAWLGGHCYLNNGALAVATLLSEGHERVALIDFDIHFGNGTSALLHEMPGAFFASIHGATDISYPYIETTPPNDRQVFVPFSEPPTPDRFLAAVRETLDAALDFGASALVISAGYDIVADDPHGIWTLAPEVLEPTGAVLGAAGIPVCVVQEGGYNPAILGACAFHFAGGLLAGAAQASRLARSPATGLSSRNGAVLHSRTPHGASSNGTVHTNGVVAGAAAAEGGKVEDGQPTEPAGNGAAVEAPTAEVLAAYRVRIDALDAALVRTLGERFEVCREIARIKKERFIPMMQSGRVEEVKRRCASLGAEHGVSPELVTEMYRLIIEESCRMEDEIIGPAGARAELA